LPRNSSSPEHTGVPEDDVDISVAVDVPLASRLHAVVVLVEPVQSGGGHRGGTAAGRRTLDGYARGWARTGTVALPVASFGRASVSLPALGTLAIDLAQATALPHFVIPSSSGHGSITLRIPGVVGLAGLPVYCQAPLLQDPGHARPTNVTADMFVP